LTSLPTDTKAFMGFGGTSLRSFRAARKRGFDMLELVVANTHVDNVQQLHAVAATNSGISDSWLHEAQRRKTLREYEMADHIYVHSEYVRQTFLAAGIASTKLTRTYLSTDPRFQPPDQRPTDNVFRIVYVGRVEMTKGLGLLLDAFKRLPLRNARLRIVGGWSTRRTRRLLQKRIARDPRIVVKPGDPLPVLQQADVFVHPSYEDGFAYAPMEALACGTPVLVSRDTGMKEYIREGINGWVLPTGDTAAIVDALHHLYRSPLAATTPLLPRHYYAERSQPTPADLPA
jgi:glycosyltransferase involved in cell wall biosynthesis